MRSAFERQRVQCVKHFAHSTGEILIVRPLPHHGDVIAAHLNDFDAAAEQIAPAETVIDNAARTILLAVCTKDDSATVERAQLVTAQGVCVDAFHHGPV